jgi:hypothetical protein
VAMKNFPKEKLFGYVGYLISWRSILLAVLLAILCPLGAAQGFTIGWNVPGTKVFISNATTDASHIQITWDGKVRGFVGVQKSSREFIPFGFNGAIDVEFRFCETAQRQNFVNDPPFWSTDVSRLGNLALTKEYLDSVTYRSALESRVKEIKRFLKGRVDQGGKDQVREID